MVAAQEGEEGARVSWGAMGIKKGGNGACEEGGAARWWWTTTGGGHAPSVREESDRRRRSILLAKGYGPEERMDLGLRWEKGWWATREKREKAREREAHGRSFV
jgi:hypothetical protein